MWGPSDFGSATFVGQHTDRSLSLGQPVIIKSVISPAAFQRCFLHQEPDDLLQALIHLQLLHLAEVCQTV